MVTPSSWLPEEVERAARSTGRDLQVLAYPGLDVEPAELLPDNVAWWCPMGWANRLLATGIDPGFQTPPADLLTRIPFAALRRRVVVDTFAHLRTDTPTWVREAGSIHVKPASIKMSALPADVRPWSTIERSDLPGDLLLQASEPVVFVREWRCFLIDGCVGAISSYLRPARDLALTGRPADTPLTWDAWDAHAECDLPGARSAADFADTVLNSLKTAGERLPHGWVLDVGELEDGALAVVEANPAWSANPYHCERSAFARAVIAAQGGPSNTPCRWKGEKHLPGLPLRTCAVPTGVRARR